MAVKIADIAKRVGVSPSTVSMILNKKEGFSYSQKTVDKVMKAVRDLDYRPNPTAKFMRMKKTNMIGIAVQSDTNYMGLNLVNLCVKRVKELKYEPILINLFDPEKDLEANLFNRLDLLQGIICVYLNQEEKAVSICKKNNYKIPIISLFKSISDHSEVREVYSDHGKAFKEGVEYLHKLGHRHIMFAGITIEPPYPNFRKEGFLSKTLQLDIDKTIAEMTLKESQTMLDAGEVLAKKIISGKLPKPSAIMCSNDELALSLSSCLMRHDVNVPNDISVMGYDDTPFAAHVYPRLTTFKQNHIELVNSAVKLLSACLDGNENQKEMLPTSIAVEAELVERDSTIPKP